MKSFFMKLIDGYEDTRLGKHFVSFSYSGSVSSKNRKSKKHDLHKMSENISSFFAATRSTFYGALFISFGLAVLLFYFLNEYAGAYEGRNFTTLTLGAVFSVISIPLLLIDKPSLRMISESRILDYIFFEFFCMKRGWTSSDRRGAPTILGVILGIILAALGIFVPVGRVALAVGVVVLVYLAFSAPEFPYLLSLFFIPYSAYIPNATFAVSFLAIISFLAFLRKSLSGKRVLNIEQYDILLFVLLTVLCIFTGFTRENARITDYVIIISLFMGYFLSSNVITNRRLADAISNGLVITTLPLAIYMDVRMIIHFATGYPAPMLFPAYLASAVVCAILSLRLIRHSSGVAKALYVVLLVLYAVSVALTMMPVCVMALLVGILTAVLCRLGKYFPLIMIPLCLPIALSHLIPEAARATVYSFLGISAPTLSESLFKNPLGIVVFTLVILLIAIRMRHRIVYSDFFEGTHLTSISVGYAGSLVALLLMLSATSGMLSGFTLYLLLSVFGMGSAALRVAKRESDNAELYFEDSKSTDSSTVNVRIH